MTASVPGLITTQQFTDAGALASNYRLYTYVQGTTTFKAAYTDIDGTIPHAYVSDGIGGQYIALNVRGELPAPLYLDDPTVYDIALKRADGSTVWTRRAESMKSAFAPLAGSSGSSLIGFTQGVGGATSRTLEDKCRESFSVNDMTGATVNAKVQAMISAVGYARFTRGAYAVTTDTFAGPMYFEDGAYLTAALGQTITMTGRIESRRQWIFRGEGDYRVNISSSGGEDARQIHASWFGVFPTNTTVINQAVAMQKAMDSFGDQIREGVFQLDQGSYHMSSGVTVPRGVHINGMGMRRTIFDISGDGFDVFTTEGDACKLSDFQFEQPSGSVGVRTSAYISIKNNDCEIKSIWLWKAKYGIVVDGSNCTINEIRGTWGEYPGVGSSAILVRANGCNIDGVQQKSNAYGPDALVEIGGAAAANFGFCTVSNIQYANPSIGVLINAATRTVSGIDINNIQYSGISGTNAAALVKLITAGANGITRVTIDGLQANPLATVGIDIVQNSTGITEDITIGDAVISGTTGTGIALTRTLGTLRDIKIGDTVDVSSRETPISYTGTMSNIRVSPLAMPNANAAYCYSFTVADDSVAVIDLHRSIFSSVVILSGASTTFGMWIIRAASSL